MKIYRDGKEIELTAEELRMAYEEKHLEYISEDIRSKTDEELDDSDCATISERFDKALGRNDSYWDCYWCTMEDVVEEYIKEGK